MDNRRNTEAEHLKPWVIALAIAGYSQHEISVLLSTEAAGLPRTTLGNWHRDAISGLPPGWESRVQRHDR